MTKRRILTGLLALVIVLTATSCGVSGTEDSSAPALPTVPEPTTAPTEAPPQLGYNALTGENDMETDHNRPVGIVITDESSTTSQLNLEAADMYFESETEGGIPRILAIFSGIDRVPDVIGPVRSARPHFVKFAKALDCIYCHIGGSQTGLETIKELGVCDIGNIAEKSAVLKATKNYSWNTSVFQKSKLISVAQKRGYSLTSSYSAPFQFGERQGTDPAMTLEVKISENYTMAFTYSTNTFKYYKHRNALSSEVHKTYTGGLIGVSNVIVMFDNRTFDAIYTSHSGKQANRYNFDMKSGEGLLATGGTCRPIRWSCSTSHLAYYESDGVTPLTVEPGKTFVCLASDTLKSRTKYY